MKTNRSNLVCIVLMSILIVFAVSLCVFYNLNALATTDVAYASSTNGIVENNLIYFSNWDSNSTTFNSGFSQQVIIENDNEYIYYLSGVGSSIVNNVFTAVNNGSGIYYKFKNNYLSSGNVIVSVYATSVSNVQIRLGSGYNSGSYTALLDGSITSLSLSSGNYSNYNFYIRSSGSNASATIHWVKLEYGNEFTGYVPNSYYYHGYDNGYEDGYNSGQNLYSVELARISSSDFITQDGSSALVSATNKYYVGNNSGIQLIKGSTGYPYGYATLWSYDYVPSQYDNSIYYYYYIPFSHGVVKGSRITFSGVSSNLYQQSNTDYSAYFMRLVNRNDSSQFGKLSYTFVSIPYSTDVISTYIDSFNFVNYTKPDGTTPFPYGYIYGYSDYPGFSINSSVSSSCDFYCNTSVAYGIVLRISEYDMFSISGDIVITTENISGMGNSQEDLINEFNRGRNQGFSEGYQYAVDNNNDYTFLGLFSAVIESPVKVISEALDFELLGYNLKNFLFAILSIALVLFVIKLFI